MPRKETDEKLKNKTEKILPNNISSLMEDQENENNQGGIYGKGIFIIFHFLLIKIIQKTN